MTLTSYLQVCYAYSVSQFIESKQMKPIRTFTVTPSLPASLEGLRALAFNLRWAWNHELVTSFQPGLFVWAGDDLQERGIT
jgi:hypothetical protein